MVADKVALHVEEYGALTSNSDGECAFQCGLPQLISNSAHLKGPRCRVSQNSPMSEGIADHILSKPHLQNLDKVYDKITDNNSYKNPWFDQPQLL